MQPEVMAKKATKLPQKKTRGETAFECALVFSATVLLVYIVIALSTGDNAPTRQEVKQAFTDVFSDIQKLDQRLKALEPKPAPEKK